AEFPSVCAPSGARERGEAAVCCFTPPLRPRALDRRVNRTNQVRVRYL
ncbi:unnamed protein product, partial [Ectocarpus sp. 12 AP-2014]